MTADDDTERFTYETWADALREGTLLGHACIDCGSVTATPKSACQECHSRQLEAVELPTEGTVYTETTIGVPPKGFEDGPIQVGVVALGETRLMGRLTGGAAIGDRVVLADVIEHEGMPAAVFDTA